MPTYGPEEYPDYSAERQRLRDSRPTVEQLQAQAWRNFMRSTEDVNMAVMAAWTVYKVQMKRYHGIDAVRHDH